MPWTTKHGVGKDKKTPGTPACPQKDKKEEDTHGPELEGGVT